MSRTNSQLTTWLGPAPTIPDICIPLDLSESFQNYPSDFIKQFNDDPATTISKHLSGHDLPYIAHYLFYCPGVYPSAITKYAFSDEKISHTFLVYFFSSITLDFLDIIQAARLLLSRVAFPNRQSYLDVIFRAFADAYLMANPSFCYNYSVVSRIAISAILFSVYQRKDSSLQEEKFTQFLAPTNINPAIIKTYYNNLKQNAVPVFFDFGSSEAEPNYSKKGYLKKVGGMFKLTGKKQRYFNIDGFVLKYYKDDTMTQQMGEVELRDSISTYIPTIPKKDTEHLVIKRFDGGPIGTKVVKGQRKSGHHTEYVAYGAEEDLRAWVSACNFVSFMSILSNFLEALDK